MKKEIVRRVEGILGLIYIFWVIFFLLPAFGTVFAMQLHGCDPAFTAFFYILWSGLALYLVVSAVKPRAVPVILFKPFVLIFCIFVYLSYLSPSLFYFSPVMSITAYFFAAPLVLWFIDALLSFPAALKKVINTRRTFFKTRRMKLFGMIFTLWLLSAIFSYVGFGRTLTIKNPEDSAVKFRISFYGPPPGGLNYRAYRNGTYSAFIPYFEKMNSSFYLAAGETYLNDSEYRISLEYTIHFLAENNLSVIIMGAPWDPVHNEIEMLTYWTVDYVNRCIESISAWMFTLNDTVKKAIRGIAFDIEDPNVEIYPISREQYENATVLYQIIFNRFKSRFPGKKLFMIQGKESLFDMFDGDRDWDIKRETVTQPPIWDVYGHMTYEATSSNPANSPYFFYYMCYLGKQLYGIKFQPWVGWFDSPSRAPPEDRIENPGMLKVVLEQVKIAKSFGFEEVVLAPSYNYFGSEEGMLERVIALASIMDGFKDFNIRITQNRRLYTDFPRYVDRLKSGQYFANEWVFYDLLANYDRGYLLPLNTGVWIFGIVIYLLRKRCGLTIVFERRSSGLPDDKY